jgi:hypothetical protein
MQRPSSAPSTTSVSERKKVTVSSDVLPQGYNLITRLVVNKQLRYIKAFHPDGCIVVIEVEPTPCEPSNNDLVLFESNTAILNNKEIIYGVFENQDISRIGGLAVETRYGYNLIYNHKPIPREVILGFDDDIVVYNNDIVIYPLLKKEHLSLPMVHINTFIRNHEIKYGLSVLSSLSDGVYQLNSLIKDLNGKMQEYKDKLFVTIDQLERMKDESNINVINYNITQRQLMLVELVKTLYGYIRHHSYIMDLINEVNRNINEVQHNSNIIEYMLK